MLNNIFEDLLELSGIWRKFVFIFISFSLTFLIHSSAFAVLDSWTGYEQLDYAPRIDKADAKFKLDIVERPGDDGSYISSYGYRNQTTGEQVHVQDTSRYSKASKHIVDNTKAHISEGRLNSVRAWWSSKVKKPVGPAESFKDFAWQQLDGEGAIANIEKLEGYILNRAIDVNAYSVAMEHVLRDINTALYKLGDVSFREGTMLYRIAPLKGSVAESFINGDIRAGHVFRDRELSIYSANPEHFGLYEEGIPFNVPPYDPYIYVSKDFVGLNYVLVPKSEGSEAKPMGSFWEGSKGPVTGTEFIPDEAFVYRQNIAFKVLAVRKATTGPAGGGEVRRVDVLLKEATDGEIAEASNRDILIKSNIFGDTNPGFTYGSEIPDENEPVDDVEDPLLGVEDGVGGDGDIDDEWWWDDEVNEDLEWDDGMGLFGCD